MRRLAVAAVAAVFVGVSGTVSAGAQTAGAPSPFLFASLAPGGRVVTSLDAGYNKRAFEPVAGERFEPRVGLVAPLARASGSASRRWGPISRAWESEESEGGATVLLGPTLAVSPSARLRLVVGGGPVVRVTGSTGLTATAGRGAERATGYVLRTPVRAAW